MDIQVATARLSRKILTTPPLSDLTKDEQIPGNAVPDGAQRGTDAAWKAWIQKNYVSVAHPNRYSCYDAPQSRWGGECTAEGVRYDECARGGCIDYADAD
ncbi:hypothetical protein H2248_004085 [Termitomyces sp. 'cryptogamus']|nr:hypothetical protein H2248_004085 [Termitomyces sp. 'cryptogamus']